MPQSVFLTGHRDIDRQLGRLRRRVQSKIVYAGLRKGGPIAAKAIKNALPSRYKGARRAVGWRFESRRKNPQGVATVKAGAAVGKRGTKSFANKQAKAVARAGSSQAGVGISHANIHWLLMGTGPRTRRSGGSTGRMPAQRELVSRAFAAVQGKISRVTRQRMLDGLEKEARKRS